MINQEWLRQDYLDLGNNGTTMYPILRIDTCTFVNPLGLQRYESTPVTSILYTFGTGNDQLLRLSHDQQFASWLSVGIRFNKIRSDGIYLRQVTNSNDVLIDLGFGWKRYASNLTFAYESYTIQENGGIAIDTLFTDNVFQNRQVLPVNLNGANRKGSGFSLSYSQGLELIADSLESSLKLAHTFSYQGKTKRYEDDIPLRGFYDSVFLDSVITQDRWEETHLTNTLGLGYIRDSLKTISLSTNYEVDAYVLNGIGIDTGFVDHGVSAGGQLGWGELRLQGAGKYVFSGYRSGDLTIKGNLDYKLAGWGNLGLFTKYGLREPDYWLQEYVSNHFIWNNNFEKETNLIGGVSLNINNPDVVLKAGVRLMTNHIYFNDQALPAQYNAQIQVGFAELSGLKKRGKFGVYSRNLIQWTDADSIIRTPGFHTTTSVFYEDSLFKKTMLTRIGFNVRYYTRFTMPDYMPALGQYYMSAETQQGGNYPFVDFFIEAKVSEASFYLKLSHINSGMMGYEYFLMPHYPARDLGVYFGLKWRFEG